MKLNEFSYQIKELENDNKQLNNQINKLKLENEIIVENMEKVRQERHNLNLQKMETEENVEVVKREQFKSFQSNLTNILNIVIKTKNKYQQELVKIKSEVESIHSNFESKT